MRQTTLLNKVLKSAFSTIPTQLKDWEYISKIEQNLKKNNITEAARYLINVLYALCRVALIAKCSMFTFLEVSTIKCISLIMD
jgi:hypothetical protein